MKNNFSAFDVPFSLTITFTFITYKIKLKIRRKHAAACWKNTQ